MGRRALSLLAYAAAISVTAVGCKKGGSVQFHEGKSRSARPAPSFNLVPASQALATSAEGYKAKLELNPIQGQTLQSTSGYTLKLKTTGQ